MFHIVDLCWDDEDARLIAGLEKANMQSHREGACEDDYESKCPYVNILPEESGKEEGSPLTFREDPISSVSYDEVQTFEQMFAQACEIGW